MADRMTAQLIQLLLKRQATFGTAESSLTNADFAECENPVTSFEPGVKDIRLSGANSGNIASVIGRYLASVSMSVPVRTGNAAASYGLLGRVLPALGMKERLSTAGDPFVRLTITDKTATWMVTDSVRNTTGAGDDWTGIVIGITTTTLTVDLSTGTYAAVDIADGVENTTRSETSTASAKAEVSNFAIYTMSDVVSDWKDLTAWGYSGNKVASKSLLHKISNVLGTGKLSYDFDAGTAMLSFEGKGACEGIATDSTQATCTPAGVLLPQVKGCSCTIVGSSAYIPISLEIDFNNEVEVTINPTATSGCGMSMIKHNGVKWSAKVYKDVAATIDPETALVSRTLGIFSLVIGSGANQITVASTKQQVTAVKSADQSGVEVHDMSGIFVDNDLTVTLDASA